MPYGVYWYCWGCQTQVSKFLLQVIRHRWVLLNREHRLFWPAEIPWRQRMPSGRLDLIMCVPFGIFIFDSRHNTWLYLLPSNSCNILGSSNAWHEQLEWAWCSQMCWPSLFILDWHGCSYNFGCLVYLDSTVVAFSTQKIGQPHNY